MAEKQDSPREIARKAGEKHYSTGKPCINGHIAPRQVGNYHCMECSRLRASAEYYRFTEADRERKRRNGRKYTLANLDKELARGREYYARTKERTAARRRAQSDKHREYLIRVKYGVTAEQYAALISGQDSKCAICRTPFTARKTRPHVDHDHETGTVRGLLCTKCNAGLGMLCDDPAIVRAAAEYLERHIVASALRLA